MTTSVLLIYTLKPLQTSQGINSIFYNVFSLQVIFLKCISDSSVFNIVIVVD